MSVLPPAAVSFSSIQDQQPLSFASEHDISQSLDSSRTMDRHAMADPSPSAEKHPKGRRKRTSYVDNNDHALRTVTDRDFVGWCRAKDKMILEEAYSSNDKPDKQARLEIVKRVELNEKEVQVCMPSTSCRLPYH